MSDYTFDDAPVVTLRGRQPEQCEKVEQDIATGFTRLLFCAAGGVGKSTIFAELARRFFLIRGKRTLVLINRESLVRQSAGRIRDETGLEVGIEMAGESASPYAPVVVASVQSIGRINRLTGFADDHFGLVVPDEAHLSDAPQWLRIMNYFHYGAESLVESWQRPKDGTYEAKAVVVGFTATPDDELLDWYQHVTVKYPYFQAVAEGWLVPAVQKSIPVKIDMRKKKVVSGPNGKDFVVRDLTASLIPVLEELADQVVKEASDRKTIAFLPSVECARLLSEALCRRGMDAVFVSGSCEDGEEKTEHFRRSGKGAVLCNAQIYNFGIDFVDVDCVAWFRATISRAFYLQGIFRATRVLRGVIDGLPTAEDRRAAIAASAKPNFLILDPLFVSDRIDLCDAYDLFAEKPEIKERMKKTGELSQDAAEKAERDFAKALEKAAQKVANREARVIDPLSWSVSIGIDRLKDFRPERAWEELPVSVEQRDFLTKHHIAMTRVRPDGTVEQVIDNRGKAQLIIGTYLKRLTLKLATPEQLNFMARLGLEFSPKTTKEEATALIGAKIGRR